MNRSLLALNVALALLLVIRIAATGDDVAALERDTARTGGYASEVARVYRGEQRQLSRLVVELGVAFAKPEGEEGAPVDLGLRLEPDFPMTVYALAPQTLELVFDAGLPRARSYTVHRSQPLELQDGGSLEPGAMLTFDTPAVELGDVAIDTESETGARALIATFDLPMELSAVQEHLRLRDADSGEAVLAEVAELPWGDRRLFRVTSASTELPDRVVLAVAPGLRPRGGDLATATEQTRTVLFRVPLLVTGARIVDGAVLLSFNHVVGLPVDGLIELEPSMPFQVYQRGAGLRITGEFPPGDVMGVRLRKGFPGTGRVTLVEDERRSLLVPDREPTVELARSGSVLSAHADPVLEVRAVNVEKFHVRARRVYDNNVVRMIQDGDARSMAPEIVREVAVRAQRNEEAIVSVDLRELLGSEDPRGLYRIDLRDDERRWWAGGRLVQLTDLGVTVRAGADAAAVQVVSIADGGPVPGAEVKIVSPKNQVLATASTDLTGVALMRWPVGAEDQRAFLVQVCATGGDQAFVDMDSHAVELADPTLGGRPYLSDRPEAYLWPARGIVRPGGRIETAVLVRDAAGKAVAGREIVVAFDQPNGRTWRQQRMTTPGSGLVTATLDIPTDAPAGTWRVRASLADDGNLLGAVPVQVEAFVPYRLEAEVVALEPLRFGGTGVVRVTGRWLDGAPAAGRRVELRARLLPGRFEPAGFAGFAFASGSEAPPPGELPAVVGALGDDGTVELRLPLPADAGEQTLSAHLMAEVMDPSGRVVRASVEEPVLRPDLHLGVRTTADGVELCAVDADGTPIARPVDATVRLERRRYRWDYRSVGRSRWRWDVRVEREVLGEWPITLAGGTAELPVAFPATRGWLAVVATAAGVTAEQVVGERPARPDRLRVEGPREPVSRGATARIAVEAPASGRGFVTLEGPTVLAAHVVELQQGHNEVLVPIPADFEVPNLHVVVTLTRPARSVGPDAGPAWLVGGAVVTVARDDVVGSIALRAPEEVLPEANLRCELSAPGATSAVIAVVDEGVLAVTRHASPDPVAFFLARRRLAVAGADAFAALMEGAKYLPGTKTGGDGDGLSSMLTVGSISPRIRPLALFAEVSLDRDGNGVVEFDLPSYEGRVRVMALAAGPTSFAGAATATVVKAPLGLLTAAPRTVEPGDRFSVPVTLRNETGAAGVVALACSAANGVELVDAGEFTVTMREGEVTTVEVAVRADSSPPTQGTPSLRFEAVLGDSRRVVTTDLHVRTLRLLREEHVGLRLDTAGEFRIPADYAADGLSAVLSIDAVPDAQLRPALEALVRYPYGCVEQTTSRGFALLACQALLPRIYGGDEVPIDAGELVQAAADRLVGMQRPNGSFGWWPGAREKYAFGTLYAMDFLVTAHAGGFRVPDSALRAGLEQVRSIADTSSVDASLRALACEVESRAGSPSRGMVEWLATQLPSPEDRALLAITLHRLGETERAAELLRTGDLDVTEREQGGMLRSPLRLRAMRFRARLAIDPGDAELPELAWAMQRELVHTDRLTTQEMGQVLRALAEYYRANGGGGAARLRGTIDGVPLPDPIGDRIVVPIRPGSVLALEAGGRGFALLTIRGHRPPRPSTGDGELSLRRVFIDIDTGDEVTTFERGRVYEARLSGRANRPMENLVIVDLLPGGLEPEAPPPDAGPSDARRGHFRASKVHVDRRDDRVLLFHADPLVGDFSFSHLVRATFPGRYGAPPLIAEAMYDPGASFVGAIADGVEVLP